MKAFPNLFTFLVGACTASSALAGVCDYRPSALAGAGISSGVAGTAGAAAVAGATAKTAGVYTLVHATTGLTMVGGTWAGASAAGTAGIIAGTGGLVGATVAVITAPVTIIGMAVAATAIGGFEAGCYFTDERVSDYDALDALVYDISLSAGDNLIYVPAEDGKKNAYIKIVMRFEGSTKVYENFSVDRLYLVNGVLYHRDFGPNTVIGHVGLIQRDTKTESGNEVDTFDTKATAQ